MEEEIKDAELERIMNEVNSNFNDRPWRHKMAELISHGGGTLNSPGEQINLGRFYIENGEKFVEFYGDFKERARSIRELQPLINYLDREGYKWK
jgi:hypothetical protein